VKGYFMGKEIEREASSLTSPTGFEQLEQKKKREEIIDSLSIVKEARESRDVVGTVVPKSKELESLKGMEEKSREAGATADYFHQLGNIASKEAKVKEPELSSIDSKVLKSLRSEEAKGEFIVNAHPTLEAQALKRAEAKVMQAMGASPERIKEIESVGGFRGAETMYRTIEDELKQAVASGRKVHETDGVTQRIQRTADFFIGQAKDPVGAINAIGSNIGSVAQDVYDSLSEGVKRTAVSISGGTNAPEVGSPLITYGGISKPLRGR
jgi:hypothetical protein